MKTSTIFGLAALGLLLQIAAPRAFAHGGGLDANGCHTNRKTGEYHCHRAQKTQPQPAPPSGNQRTDASGVVKLSRSGICHDQTSAYYTRTIHFKPFDSLQACRNAGGRLPYGGSSPSTVSSNAAPASVTKSPSTLPQDAAVDPSTGELVAAADGEVRMTKAGVCHDSESPQYEDFFDYTSFPDMTRCLRSGGRDWTGRALVPKPLPNVPDTPAYGDRTVKMAKSGNCYEPKHPDWSSIGRFDSYPDLASCLRSGGREVQR